ncbi:hypothetical protein [Lysinibacillus fusiformis]|uniref:hypothetical protein n=1 Tax=Lysinibacillus fusiformis TaxID=28031 RepID=UPI0008927A76|nr:hypothetical protein [Lysinibacillus fusiformis]SCX38348.1 hypothetical protein SAMN02787108_00276 [Lysinibacillus fusiformis]SDB05301.1 hypothetical protein SAMN02787070_00264 [Lysinibacillus fusiformis]SFH75035.1 hypothetical protein SAMN02787080_00263 [Lysinibacillus fusiformis]SFT29736.1 hypothetical protein SAMN02787099_04546 [Lysinibacillus fusiformis]
MRIGYSHADVYDRESEYWQDIEDAQKAQIEAQKNSSMGATNGERKKLYDTGSVPQEDAK